MSAKAVETPVALRTPSNSFRRPHHPVLDERMLSIRYHHSSGLVSVNQAFQSNEMDHDHSWLRRTEPEEHLAGLARSILRFGIANSQGACGSILGISHKDESLISLVMESELLTGETLITGNESKDFLILDALHDSQSDLQRSNARLSQFDFVVCRHLLEHSFEPAKTIRELRRRLNSGGLLLVEVPDCEESLRYLDYSILWEEHANYFTPTSLDALLTMSGLRVRNIDRLVSGGESILIAWAHARNGPPVEAVTPADHVGLDFVVKFPLMRKLVSASIRTLVGTGVLVVAGANHSAANFIEVFGDTDLQIVVVDDDPNKQGRLFTKFNLEIMPPSDTLRMREEITFALISTHPGRSSRFTDRLCQFLNPSTPLMSVSDFVVSKGSQM